MGTDVIFKVLVSTYPFSLSSEHNDAGCFENGVVLNSKLLLRPSLVGAVSEEGDPVPT